MYSLLLILFFVTSLAYIGLLGFSAVGWILYPSNTNSSLIDLENNSSKGVSIIIPFRNEAQNLPTLLSNLTKQNLPSSEIEIILVNDHSSDFWEDAILPFKGNCCVRVLESRAIGKKNAIFDGVINAKYPIILTTDADCYMSINWVKSMMWHYQQHEDDLLFGPVKLEGDSSLLSYFQEIDYMSMAVVGAGASNLSQPFLCSGANLMFSKEKYLELFKEIRLEYSSGDDVFLLHAFKQRGYQIQFVQNKDAMVFSNVQKSFKSLVNQRVRWGAKAAGYKDGMSVYISLVVFVINFSLAIGVFSSVCSIHILKLTFLFLVLKIVCDTIFIMISSEFFGVKFRLLSTVACGVCYPFWITIIAFKGFVQKVSWKGRP